MKTETIVLLFNGFAFLLNAIYQLLRLYYERQKIAALEKQARLMELERK